MTETFNPLAPQFEEQSTDFSAITADPCATLRVDEAETWKQAKEDPDMSLKAGRPVYKRGLKVQVSVVEHVDASFVHRKEWMYLIILGKGSFNTTNLLKQAGLDEILAIFDSTHPNYDPTNTPQWDGMDDDAVWEAIGNFYATGAMEDAAGTSFISNAGGLVGVEFKAKIGVPQIKPKRVKDENDVWVNSPDEKVEKTGFITPLKP